MLIYATQADLTNWMTTTPPSTAAQLLRTASLLVRRATRAAVYTVDTTGLPTDTDVAQAFKDATCAHAAAMANAGLNPDAGGVVTAAKTATAKSVGSASISYAGTKEAAASLAWLADNLAPQAVEILQQAGLIPATVWTVG